jgi:hypothetical protein
MRPFVDKTLRAGAKLATALAQLWERRASGSEMRKRKEMEAERIDRLRYPAKYQGR